jgi:WD40 repeat protein
VTCVAAFNREATRLARVGAVKGSRGYDSLIQVWDLTTNAPRHSLRAKLFFANPDPVVFSPASDLLAAACGPVLRLWDVAGERLLAEPRAGTKYVRGLTFTADGMRLATVSYDKLVRLWAAPDLTEVGHFEWQIGKLTAIDASRDGCRMAAGSTTGTVVLWDVD